MSQHRADSTSLEPCACLGITRGGNWAVKVHQTKMHYTTFYWTDYIQIWIFQ